MSRVEWMGLRSMWGLRFRSLEIKVGSELGIAPPQKHLDKICSIIIYSP